MSGTRLRIPADKFNSLSAALRKAEEVVFLYATFTANAFNVHDVEVVAGADIASQSTQHVVLADDIRPRVIKYAWDNDLCLIEAHSHGGQGLAKFSRSDLLGFEEWVSHVRWRLRGRPYAALVTAGKAWDALAWLDDDEPKPVDAIEITTNGDTVIKTLRPTNATLATLAARREK